MKYQLHIPKPCSENWNVMTPTERGAFCSKCKKEVTDYTHASKYQLAKILDEKGAICGKFRSQQLNTDISSSRSERISKSPLFFGISSLLLFSSPVFSQQQPDPIHLDSAPSNYTEQNTNYKSKDSTIVSGIVTDGTTPLPGVNILLKGTKYGVLTDFDGKFSIMISDTEFQKKTTLSFSYLGFESQDIQIDKNNTDLNHITMILDETILGEVVVVKKQNIFRRIGNLFR
ncbi:carboxypeptidase-like regulatory domain-containing protein [uncultured Formosa sp.]|uniref:carboxypeptidase-like regulatory domain-containing protein n=1 Tax=uncultured Formosa sp. TaxID=255435 RepID=UPI002611A0D1|nr:carboxypeptidase-like regulatory domain-containing protein [uncultured Formosa sp.]